MPTCLRMAAPGSLGGLGGGGGGGGGLKGGGGGKIVAVPVQQVQLYFVLVRSVKVPPVLLQF
jgi:hypothetical protein